MPVYVYEILDDNGEPEKRFECLQPISEPALTTDPETGKPVRRVFCAPYIASRYTERQTRDRLDNKRIEKAGFTKYEKDKSTGTYHRVAGTSGPQSFKKPSH